MKVFWRTIALVLVDFVALSLVWFCAMILSDVAYVEFFREEWLLLLIAGFVTISVNALFKVYAELLRYISFNGIVKVMISGFLTSIYFVVVSFFSPLLTIKWAIICSVFYAPLICFIRVSYRFAISTKNRIIKSSDKQKAKRVIIVGAGSAGSSLVHEILNSFNFNLNPVCILDDDEKKILI